MYTKNVKRKNIICTEYNLTDCKKNLLCRQNKSTWYKKYNKPAKYEMYFKLNLIWIQSVLNTNCVTISNVRNVVLNPKPNQLKYKVYYP